MNNTNSKIGKEAHGILLIGNAAGAILIAQPPDKLPISISADMPDGIEAATQNPFTTILIVMSDVAAGLKTNLEKLRKSTDARILLLARMYEEPLAINLVNHIVNGSGLADDYLICPIQIDKLCEAIQGKPEIPASGDYPQTAVAETAVEERIRQLEKLATEDDLTGLKNRRYIREFARQIIERAKRENGRVTVLVFDIDDLKRYNDVYGHSAGDEVLKKAAILIQRCCRKHDVVGRMGGDEFAVVFWDDPRCVPPPEGSERRSFTAEHPRELILIAKRFRRELEKTELKLSAANGKEILTISGGLATLGTDGQTADELFEKADQALLDAKRSGKNRVYLVGSAHSSSSPQAERPQNDIDKIE
jgi:GGDEF domain-containing protein